ncbi:MAG: hypothetical protein PHW41_01230, partial [Eubacteriales bacterium]|nr:hypothetical protein [Eubacteriales bacterium]
HAAARINTKTDGKTCRKRYATEQNGEYSVVFQQNLGRISKFCLFFLLLFFVSTTDAIYNGRMRR